MQKIDDMVKVLYMTYFTPYEYLEQRPVELKKGRLTNEYIITIVDEGCGVEVRQDVKLCSKR